METTIHKCRKTQFYAKISNNLLQNEHLSFKARGMMSYILSLPEQWTLCISHLSGASPQGKEAVQSALRELQAHGYMELEVVRDVGSGRVVGRRWMAYDDPSDNPNFKGITDNRVLPSSGNPAAGKPATIKETAERKETTRRKEIEENPSGFLPLGLKTSAQSNPRYDHQSGRIPLGERAKRHLASGKTTKREPRWEEE
jgi:hypothetical protein